MDGVRYDSGGRGKGRDNDEGASPRREAAQTGSARSRSRKLEQDLHRAHTSVRVVLRAEPSGVEVTAEADETLFDEAPFGDYTLRLDE